MHTVRDVDALRALSHPARVELLERLREPASAAEVARQLGQPRQRVNYHLKALDEAGLVEKVGTRRQGNFVESLYRATAECIRRGAGSRLVEPATRSKRCGATIR